VHHVQIEVFETKRIQGLTTGRLDIFGVVLGIPKLGHDEKILAVYDTFLDAFIHGLSYFFLVAVERSTVYQTVTSLDGELDRFVDFVVILKGIEGSESNGWNDRLLVASTAVGVFLAAAAVLTHGFLVLASCRFLTHDGIDCYETM
jgi:hypothetical protein